MIDAVKDIALETIAPFGAVIDVRSPAEFAEDHIPGAINLPVLSNEERAEVGTIYTQDSRFKARRLGAAHVARNVARHLETALADCDAKFRPLLYCWRGGMRSNSMATILSHIGWRVGVLDGGYRTWRRAVVRSLFDEAALLNLILIDGETGSAKTEILRRMTRHGAQAIDLEGIAAHRGSVFGADAARAQPSQKLFESHLFDQLRRLDPSRPIAVEAESNRIGRINIPKRFWASMRASPRIFLSANVESRAAYLPRAYADVIEAPGAIAAAIERLKPFHAKKTIEDWQAMAAEGKFKALAEALMRAHYDPLYQRARSRGGNRSAGVIEIDRLDENGIDHAAKAAAAIVNGLSRRS